ncbi:hypothetical protein BSG92_15575 (plasmid) [Lactiplantibacillus plantarum subsp. plantarum]|nr:restriction endonuclease subunit S [Lactiplantibacillus plantarum]APP13726.1 hypothetical protein BSG92_15575 [Lactiplantibacillus plantarum subsp. plantarum]
MKDNQAKYPQLRFKGFTDPWEKRKLGEISKTTIGEFVIKNKQYSDAPYPVYNGGISYTGFYDEFNNEGDKIVISARGANAGFVNYIDGRFWAGNSCYSVDILDRKKFSVEFMYQFLKRNQHLFTDHQQAANIPSVSKKDVATFIVQFPTQNEQREIASFFKQLDNLITLHQCKLAKLKELKQGYLQKLFPRNGSKFPQLRFAGFADAWEQRKLGEVATFLNGRAYKQDELLDSGKYKVLRVGNFYTNDSWYYSNMELGDKYYVDKGDLVYTWSATFGPHIWSGEKVIYHYHIWKVELSKFLDRNFTLQLLEADKARLLSSTNGSTMIHVTKGDMESKIVSIPNIDEQKQIGSFFKQLDNTITLHQRKLEKLQELKKGYLQKMFC